MSKTSITIYKLITALFLIAYGTINAQYSISGPSSTDVNDTETFTAVNTSNLLGKNWNVTGSGITFTIVSGQGTSTSNIRFTSIGNAIVNFSAVTPGTFNSVFISKNVQVQGTVVGQVSITSGITERCKGSGTSDYNASASNATSYDWSLSPTSAGSINSNGTVTWNSNYSGTATVSVTANGPNNSSSSANRIVTVESPPSKPVLSIANSTLCAGQQTTISISNGQNGFFYRLFRGNGTPVSSFTANIPSQFGTVPFPVPVSTGGTYYATVEEPGNDCGSSPQSDPVSLTVNQGLGNPELNNPNSITKCAGSETWSFNITGGSAANMYSNWRLVNDNLSTINGNGTSATVQWDPGIGNGNTVSIQVDVTSECGDTTVLSTGVTVYSGPIVPNFSEGDTIGLCSGDNTTLSIGFARNTVDYTLYRDGVSTGLTESPDIDNTGISWQVSQPGLYNIVARSNTNVDCGDTVGTDVVEVVPITPGIVEITSTPADLSNICAGTPITLSSNGNNNTWSTGERTNSIVVTPIAGQTTIIELTANDADCGSLQTRTISITPGLPIAWYTDNDNDGLGDAFATPIYDCSSPGNNYVDNNDDLCPDDAGNLSNSGCPPGLEPENRNWMTTQVYDLDGTLKASSKSYYNDLGRLEQTQNIDIETSRTWASSVLYDGHGRTTIQTLSAPVDLSGTFQYQPDFIRNDSGTTYSLSDFEDTSNDPSKVANTFGTLGWYYSDLNDDNYFAGNQYQDITEHPLSRTIYSTLNPGSALKVQGGNKVDSNTNGTIDAGDQWPQNYSFSMPATNELTLTMAFGEASYGDILTTKTVSRDVHGEENVVFTDKDGLVLAAARSGGTTASAYMYHSIGEQGYVDVHIPEGIVGLDISNQNAVEIFDMISETKLVTPASSLPSGFYRVAVIDLANYVQGSITVGYKVNYYDYSLNEYDEADRLVRSYQPLGTTKGAKPTTLYEYDAIGRLVYTKSPDEGEAWFKYREDGQIRYSQNSKQRDPNGDGNFADAEFSYTNYDDRARPIESGVLESMAFDSANPDTELPTGTKKEVVITLYDEQEPNFGLLAMTLGSRGGLYPSQDFVSGNVSYTENDHSKTWYSYDVYGRVKWIIQDIQGLGLKTIDYQYDPVTGLVTQVVFQKLVDGEQFIHLYEYDVKDRLTRVFTQTDDRLTTTLQAEYTYYETGGLKRVDLADGAQGMDYVYNLSGQLKSINHPGLDMTNDPGNDANDLFGMQVDYHTNDYARTLPNITQSNYGTDQYNGNIKGIRWNTNNPMGSNPSEYVYSYDRNNWLTAANFDPSGSNVGTGGLLPEDTSSAIFADGSVATLEATDSFTLEEGFHAQPGSDVLVRINPNGGGGIMEGDYDVSNITYDANGNIQSLTRNKSSLGGSNAMDNLSYTYKTDPQDGPNQLVQVTDSEGDVANADDIGSQPANNYTYNAIGQLVGNTAENITYIYNASGLVTEVIKGSFSVVKFYYNDRNHRVKKESFNPINGDKIMDTYYVRDVSGQVMAIYSQYNGDAMALTEQPVYGTGRIGVAYNSSLSGTEGNRSYVYELTDHLGNVRALFSKLGNNTSLEGYTDYYPFGMPMPGRQMQDANQYRYAFQGQEKDTETGKEAFELRLWDSRIGRWLSTDPYGQYASPYLGMGNNPISKVDPDGGFDWYIDENGERTYDSRVKSQADLKSLGIEGTYLGKTFYDAVTGNIGFSNGFMGNLRTGEGMFFLDEVVVGPSMTNPFEQTPWMDIAVGELGQTEIAGDQHNSRIMEYLHTTGSWWETDETAWCSGFCNWTLQQAGIEGTNSATALSWRDWDGGIELEEPAFGAIATKTRRGGGHVGFVAGVNSEGQLIILGGNQNNSVRYSAYSANFQFHYPSGYVPNYNLPLLEVNNGKVTEN